MKLTREEDLEMVGKLSKQKILDLFFVQVRNIWKVDGLYFLGIEDKFGTQAATWIDTGCWQTMGGIEARHLREMLDIKKIDPKSLIYMLRNTGWALDILEKETEIAERKAIFRVTKCGTQLTRIKKRLGVFACKKGQIRISEKFRP